VTAGLDWAGADHAISVVDDRGRQVARKTVEHTAAGLRAMVRLLAKHGGPRSRSNATTDRSSTLGSTPAW
jgi:hypothetical protein